MHVLLATAECENRNVSKSYFTLQMDNQIKFHSCVGANACRLWLFLWSWFSFTRHTHTLVIYVCRCTWVSSQVQLWLMACYDLTIAMKTNKTRKKLHGTWATRARCVESFDWFMFMCIVNDINSSPPPPSVLLRSPSSFNCFMASFSFASSIPFFSSVFRFLCVVFVHFVAESYEISKTHLTNCELCHRSFQSRLAFNEMVDSWVTRQKWLVFHHRLAIGRWQKSI